MMKTLRIATGLAATVSLLLAPTALAGKLVIKRSEPVITGWNHPEIRTTEHGGTVVTPPTPKVESFESGVYVDPNAKVQVSVVRGQHDPRRFRFRMKQHGIGFEVNAGEVFTVQNEKLKILGMKGGDILIEEIDCGKVVHLKKNRR